jgi:hypothetical protein
MAAPPLPDVPVVRCRLDYQDTTSLRSGSRFFLSYTGSAPSGANCTTLAGDIEAAWVTNLQTLINDNFALVEVDVLDIATDAGLSGQWTGTEAGTRSGTPTPNQVANNVEFGIARRYRGGKPRMYLPGGVMADLNDAATWEATFVTDSENAVAAFFAEIEGLSVGSMGTLKHVNLSYYQGYRTRMTGGGQQTFAPKYRSPNALHDDITGYFGKRELGSQRRRRTSTTY